jgi:NAD(P)-dependent dehydrogenase (short-subunit alcohol dehydrogenase family)
MPQKPLSEQVVVVMGASSGIGRATALAAAARGATVVAAARTGSALDTLVQEITSTGGTASSVVADTAAPDQVEAVAARAVDRYGRIDTWAQVAGVAAYGRFLEIPPEEFQRVVDVTFMGGVHAARAALPRLRAAGGGTFVQVSSVVARRSFPVATPYSAAKHAVDGFVEALRQELAHDGEPITVAQILPAAINTPFFDKARTHLGVKPGGPPPVYQPQLVADAILHAAEHPTRDVVVGGGGVQLLLLQKLSPRLMDLVGRTAGIRVQRTDVPKGPEGPDGLFEAVDGEERVEGDVTRFPRRTSVATWVQTHPPTTVVRRAAARVRHRTGR